MTHTLTALITLLAVLLQLGVMVNVGRARGRYQVQAPATTGHPVFERAYRIQMNTLESTLMFLPALWMFALYLSEPGAAAVGAVWLLGRVIYSIAYMADAGKRGTGFVIGLVAIAVLTLGGLFGVVRALLG